MKPLLALTDRCCRWPVGPDPGIGRTHLQLWCGAPRAPGDWFCPDHMKVGCPGRKITPAKIAARNLMTIKLALTRRRPAMSREPARQDEHFQASPIDRPQGAVAWTERSGIDVTGSVLGDPPPGRTPWAEPARSDQAARTGLSATSAALSPPEPEFADKQSIRLGEGDKSEPSPQEIARILGDDVFEEGAKPETAAPRAVPQPSDMIGQLPSRRLSTDVERPLAGKVTPANMDGSGLNMDGSAVALRAVAPLTFDAIALAEVPTNAPLVEWMAPADLLVDGRYQRDLSPRSLDLIKRIAERWDWRRFKPPIVAWTERGFEIIDGQHTAIGAATRGIEKIPVLVVEATDMKDRATAFVGHNQDRLSITAIQMHQAKLAAGDEDALTVQQVIDKAGATLVVGAYGARGWRPGETVAITTIDALAKRRGAMKARQVVEVLVKAEMAPVSAAAIKAADMLMNTPAYDEMDLDHLPATIKAAGDIDAEAKLDGRTHCIPAWEAMGRIWFRKCRKIRRAA